MTSKPRRIPTWTWIVATPILLIAVAWAALFILLPPGRAQEIVKSQLSRRLEREVSFEGVALSIWPPVRLSVKELELAEPEGFERGPAFAAKSVDLDLDAVALLLKRQVKVRRLELVEPALHLVLNPDGTTNFEGMVKAEPKEPAPRRAMDLDIREFKVANGGIVLDDVGAKRRTSFKIDTRTDLRYERAPGAAGSGERIATGGETVIRELMLGPIAATNSSELDQGLAKLEWKLEHKGKYDAPTKRLALEDLALQLGNAKFSLSGLVDDVGKQPRYDLKAKGSDVDLQQLLAWVAVADAQAVHGLSGRGRLSFDVAARGVHRAGAIPQVTGTAKLAKGAFMYEGAAGDVKDLSFDVQFQPDRITVPNVRGVVAGQLVMGRVQLSRLADPLVDFAVRGNLDLSAVGPLVAPPDAKLAGTALVDLSGRGRAKDPGALALAGAAILKDVSVENAKLPKKIEKVNGRIDFSRARAVVRGLSVQAGKSSYVLDATVTRPLASIAEIGKVDPAVSTFTFRSHHLDLADLLPTAPGAPYLPNVVGGGKVAIDRLIQGKLDVTGVQADVKLSPGALESPAFTFAGYGGRVSGNARFDLTDTKTPRYLVHAIVDKVKAADILRTWTPVENLVEGTLSSTFDFSGAGSSPEMLRRTLVLKGLAALADGRIRPGAAMEEIARVVRVPKLKDSPIAATEFPFRVESGRVITDAVTIRGPNGDEHKLAGAAGFDGSLDYAVSLTLPPAAVQALDARSAMAAGALMDPQGRMILDLRVTGTAKAPRVALDTRAMAERVAGRASDLLADQREKIEKDAREAARQILAEKLGGQRDSTAKPVTPEAIRDTLRTAARDLLDGFLGKKKKPLPAPPADTTKP